MPETLSSRLFALEAGIRYVALVQQGAIVEMEQSPDHPTGNPHETDRLEELIVNPILLETARRRADLDMGGLRYLIVRYAAMYQLVMPFEHGHLSIGIELDADPTEVADRVAVELGEAR